MTEITDLKVCVDDIFQHVITGERVIVDYVGERIFGVWSCSFGRESFNKEVFTKKYCLVD
jgi:hypothetical protein